VVDGIGLNDLMQAAGLTRGGFTGISSPRTTWRPRLARAWRPTEQWRQQTDRSLSAWIKAYLSDAHREQVGGLRPRGLAGDARARGPGGA
jgi:TetR/AcrR family transcriptional repressor of nem operon